jgi:hypothetical protein
LVPVILQVSQLASFKEGDVKANHKKLAFDLTEIHYKHVVKWREEEILPVPES